MASIGRYLRYSRNLGLQIFILPKFCGTTEQPFRTNHFGGRASIKQKFFLTYPPVGLEGQITPKSILKNVNLTQQELSVLPAIQTYGFGDGGGGPIKENLEFAIILKTILGLPSSQLSTVQDFFEQLEKQSETFRHGIMNYILRLIAVLIQLILKLKKRTANVKIFYILRSFFQLSLCYSGKKLLNGVIQNKYLKKHGRNCF